MRLNYRYTIAYAVITFLVLSLGFAIVYAALSRSTTRATVGKLEHLNSIVASQLRDGHDYTGHPARANVQVKKAAVADTAQVVQIRDEWDAALQSEVAVVRLSTFPLVRGQRYRITSRASVVEPRDVYLTGLVLVFAWTFVFLLALVVILSEVISWYILKPFNDTLRGIQQFQLGQKSPIDVQPTNTAEFHALNEFLVRMTARAQSDYRGLKEFSENASHELQTPIASIKAKIELLMDSELEEKQLHLLTGMHDELERLAKINQALTLLAKLEHFESQPDTFTDFSLLVAATEASFADLAELKDLHTTQRIVPGVRVAFDESLAQLLLNNLLSNAIRHNLPGGEIRLELTTTHFLIQNTGRAPSVPVQELFGRFKKGNAALDSIGIGLAIVKRISELYGHHIDYTYQDGWHTIELRFAGAAAA